MQPARGFCLHGVASPAPESVVYDGREYSAAEIKEERRLNHESILRFGQRAFPHWFTAPPSRFHRYLDNRIRRMANGIGGSEQVVLGPRGNAKSTVVSKTSVLWISCHQREILAANGSYERVSSGGMPIPLDCILIVSYALSLPTSFVIDIRRELEMNNYLRSFYPEAFGAGTEKWTERQIRTNNGVWICAASTGQSIRGFLPEGKRPRWVVLDDCENSKHVSTLEQREKTWKWLFNDVRPTGEAPERKADILAVGTLVHRDSLLARLSDVWISRSFRAVRKFAHDSDPEAAKLWEEWRGIYLDVEGELGEARVSAARLWEVTAEKLLDAIDRDVDPDDADLGAPEWWTAAFKTAVGGVPSRERDLAEAYQAALYFCDDFRDDLPAAFAEFEDEWQNSLLESIRDVTGRHSRAWEFYQQHREAMDRGARVLWPEAQPYYRLMCLMAENPIAFLQEMQNEIRTADQQLFTKDAWTFYNVRHKAPTAEYMRNLFPSGTQFFGACDPSKGKKSRKHDYSAIIVLAKPQLRPWHIAWAWVRREKPTKILEEIVRLNAIFQCRSWAIESVQFQEYFADDIIKAADEAGQRIRVHKWQEQTQKEIRIQGLESHVVNGRLLFPGYMIASGGDNAEDTYNPLSVGGFRLLWEQLIWFGEKDIHDDGPDALDMALDEGLRILRTGKTQIISTRVNRTGNAQPDPLAQPDPAVEAAAKEAADARRAEIDQLAADRKKQTDGEDTLQKLRRLGLLGKTR